MSASTNKKQGQQQQSQGQQGKKQGQRNEKGGSQATGNQKGKAQSKASAKPAQDGGEDVKRDQKLQAILLADSFTTTFRPITLECPKVLLPLVNVPMIDYTIEFLAQNGVEEIFVFCGWFSDMLESYLKTSRWNSSSLSIRCISSNACSSAGDALRELDGMNIVRSDPFILISGDVVSNLNLKKAIAFHKQKRKEDNNNIMTVVLKKVQKSAGAKPIMDDLVVGMNRKSSQIVIFEDSIDKKDVHVPIELMENSTELSFATDLLDCNVDICSPELMLQFSDNFDYQDIRRDFIRNEVCNVALGKHIYGYVIQNEYAARVQDPRTYHSICRDIVTRWAFPLVPDVQLLNDSTYSQSKRYVYREQNVKISRTANITEEIVIGEGSSVGDHSTITRSIIARGVHIGHNCKIVDSHIWKGAVIEDNCTITNAIICDKSIVRKGSVVSSGCILSFGVEVGPNVTLKENTRLTTMGDKQNNPNIIGNIWTYENEPNSYHGFDATSVLQATSIGCTERESWKTELWKAMPKPEDDSEDEEDDGDDRENSDENAFTKIVLDMVATAMKEGHPADSVLMEIKGFKFAQNKSFGDCIRGILPGVLGSFAGEGSMQSVILSLRDTLKKTKLGYVLIKAMIHDEHDQFDLIVAIEDFLLQPDCCLQFNSILRFILQIFFDSGLLTEEGILNWSETRASGVNAESQRLKLFQDPKVQEFIEWLQASDDEDDEDDDEEEGDDDDEDDDEDSDDDDN